MPMVNYFHLFLRPIKRSTYQIFVTDINITVPVNLINKVLVSYCSGYGFSPSAVTAIENKNFCEYSGNKSLE
jgi:hypothetical protein